MKLLIASDIHGSAYWCRKLMEAWEREKPEKMILLGDLLYHGPRNDLPQEYAPKEVIRMLNGHAEDILCVRGNCEAEVDQMVLDFPVMAEYAILYLNGHLVYMTHGHISGKDNPPKLRKGDILLHGHTHLYAAEQRGDWHYVNPGSVSLPKEEREHTYMIWEDGAFILKTMDGTVIGHPYNV